MYNETIVIIFIFFIIFTFPLILGFLHEVTFELNNASHRSNINIVQYQKLRLMFRNKLSVREQSETDSRNSDVRDEIVFPAKVQARNLKLKGQ